MCCFRQDAIRYLIYSSPTIIIQLCDDISLFMNLGVNMHRCPFYFHGRLVLIWGKDVYFISFRCVQESLFYSIFHFQQNSFSNFHPLAIFPHNATIRSGPPQVDGGPHQWHGNATRPFVRLVFASYRQWCSKWVRRKNVGPLLRISISPHSGGVSMQRRMIPLCLNHNEPWERRGEEVA